MIRFILTAGTIALLAGCAVAHGYGYGYGGYEQPYPGGYYDYGPAYGPAYGSVNIGIWGGGGDHHGGDWHGGGHDRHGGTWHGGGRGGPWGPSGGGHGGGHGTGGHGGR